MRMRIMKSGIFMMALVLFAIINLRADAQEISKTELEQRALSNFNNQRYDRAATDYQVLNNMFPKDTKYAYFLGRSYLHSNQNIERAAELLKYVATRNYGEDAYFFLGRAYLLNYLFDDATLAFRTFQKTATGRQIEKYDVDYWINICENAKQAAGVAQVISVENLKALPADKIEIAFNENMDGKYVYIPDEFKSERDLEANYQTLMFIPLSSEVGDYLYFDSKTKKGNGSSDIFRVKRITAENFSLPEALPGIVNTAYDEAYPYYSKSTGILYFSSKGHSTSGGFDIFKTSYDSVNAQWRKPEKLNFPINTPFDDFLYTPMMSNDEAIFLTNRNTGLREVEAYTIKNSVTNSYISPLSQDEIHNCAMLMPAAIDITVLPPVQELVLENATVDTPPLSQNYKSYSPEDEYGKLISEGMDLQSKSDSLNWSTKELGIRANQETDYLKKKELIANITTIDKEAKRMQLLAEEKFLLAEQIRTPNNVETGKESNSVPIVNAKSNNEITQVTYKENQSSNTVKKVSGEDYQRGMDAAKNATAELVVNFSISSASPYSNDNPIPVAVIPSGLIYRIQLGAFSNTIPENAFGGLSPLSKERNPSETKYFVGYFSSLVKAREALDQVKKYGYPDAFIVSYFDSKKIPIQQAREIEFAEK
jgi:hypothetical protein